MFGIHEQAIWILIPRVVVNVCHSPNRVEIEALLAKCRMWYDRGRIDSYNFLQYCIIYDALIPTHYIH